MDEAEVNPFAADYDGGAGTTSYGGNTYASTSAGAYSNTYTSSYAAADTANPFGDSDYSSTPVNPSTTSSYGGAYANTYSTTPAAPAAASTSTAATGSGYGSSFGGAPAAAPAKAPKFTSVADDLHTVEQLRAELKRRERELEQKNELIDTLGAKVDEIDVTIRKANWPRFYPVMYHDIPADILDETRRKHVRSAYILWMCTAVSYIWNFLLVLIAFTAGVSDQVQNNSVMAFVWQFVLVLTGPSFSLFFWYRAIYNAARIEGATPSMQYWWFFFHFTIHTIVMILCFVGIFFNNGGIISMINAFGNEDVGATWGIMFLSSALLWGLIALASGFLLVMVFRYYKTNGGKNPSRKDVEKNALIGGAEAASQAY